MGKLWELRHFSWKRWETNASQLKDLRRVFIHLVSQPEEQSHAMLARLGFTEETQAAITVFWALAFKLHQGLHFVWQQLHTQIAAEVEHFRDLVGASFMQPTKLRRRKALQHTVDQVNFPGPECCDGKSRAPNWCKCMWLW